LQLPRHGSFPLRKRRSIFPPAVEALAALTCLKGFIPSKFINF
jgi:hypothetical protein